MNGNFELAFMTLSVMMSHPHTCEKVVDAGFLVNMKEKAMKGIKLFGSRLFADTHAEVGSLIDVALGLTLLLVLLGTVFAPVGLVTFAGVNRTAANVATGTTNGTIWDAIVPLVFLCLIVGVFGVVKHSYAH